MSSIGREKTSISLKRGLGKLRPPLKDWRFWAVQVLVAFLALAHDLSEGPGFEAELRPLYNLPFNLAWALVVYVAWAFGFSGALITGLWVLLSTVPNFVYFHQGAGRLWEISQVTSVVVIALLVGHTVDQKKEAYRRARLYASHSLRIQEDERKRISRELHDETIQMMAMVCQRLDDIRYFSESLPRSAKRELLAARQSMEQTIDGMRNLVGSLRPPILDDLGLVASIQQLSRGLAKGTGTETIIEVIGIEGELVGETKTGIFRIAQEAFRNVERHAKATQVNVTITFAHGEAVLEVVDNGVGFEVPVFSDTMSKGHFGLLGMLEHAEKLGGRLDIDSRPGTGTRVRAVVPLASDKIRNALAPF